ncbi:MAG: Hpt domain-containing protein [Lachnospiraceae bacterium]|nr:Hpt domain-containing protein [Lachnospiraceae bacterium]
MKKALVIIPNVLIIGFILVFIVRYADTRMEESNQREIEEFEKMTVTVTQIVTNYLADEQHLCDIWANYVNRSAEAGTPMTAEEAISYIRKAKISPEISGHLIFLDDPNLSGISTTENPVKPIDPDRLESMLLTYLPKGKIAPPEEEAEEEDVLIPDFVFTIPELDVNSGLGHCGSKRSYMTTLKMYLDTAVDNADELEKLWNARDMKNTTIRVHALKSTSRVIGALSLGDHAAELEKAGDLEDVKKLEKEMPVLLEEYRKLAADLEPLHAEEKQDAGEDTRPLISDDYLNEAYTALSQFCASYS